MAHLRMLSALTAALTFSVCAAQAAPDAPATAPSNDTCLILARAKHQQWVQPRVLVEQTKTFADGSTKATTILAAENTAYSEHKDHWKSVAVSVRERGVPPPVTILKSMGLASCSKGEAVQEANQAATVYSYDYLPDAHGFVAHGKMWIADSSGLPLREEMQDPTPPANEMVATAISATYVYNDDVQIPRGAELADSTRLFQTDRLMMDLQSGVAGGGAMKGNGGTK